MIYLKYLLCAHGNVPEKKEISQNPLRNIMKQQERVRRGGERQKLSLLFMSKLEWTEGGCRWEMLIWMRDDRYSSESHNRRQARWLMSRWKKTSTFNELVMGEKRKKKPTRGRMMARRVLFDAQHVQSTLIATRWWSLVMDYTWHQFLLACSFTGVPYMRPELIFFFKFSFSFF